MALLCLSELDNVWRLLYIFAKALRTGYLVGTGTLDLLVWIHSLHIAAPSDRGRQRYA